MAYVLEISLAPCATGLSYLAFINAKAWQEIQLGEKRIDHGKLWIEVKDPITPSKLEAIAKDLLISGIILHLNCTMNESKTKLHRVRKVA